MKHEHIIFFDIETVTGARNYADLSEAMQAQWQRKYGYTDQSMSMEEYYRDQSALYPEFGKIVCISYGGYDDSGELTTHSFADSDERQILKDFFDILDEFPHYALCGHNSKSFDIPYLCKRGLIQGLKLPRMLRLHGKKPREIPHLDTLEMRKFGDYKGTASLALLCAVFDIPTPKDDIDGSQVSRVFREDNDIDRIATYCEKDVVATARVHERLVG